MVRGYPSRMNPSTASGRLILASTSSSTSSSGTRMPACITLFTRRPRSSPISIWWRSMSPVDICGTCMQLWSSCAWVPLPEPGGPKRIRAVAGPGRTGISEGTSSTANAASARREALVVAHDELRLDLVYRVHGHTHHDQQRCSTKIEIDVQAIQKPARKIGVNEVSDHRQPLQLDSRNHDLRNDRENGQVQAAHHRD